MVNKIQNVYFSPYGGTKRTAELIEQELIKAGDFQEEGAVVDLLENPPMEPQATGEGFLTIVSMPVYSGRIPEAAKLRLAHLKGNRTPAIAVAVYGNRDYDDALIELTDFLAVNGFKVIAAAALIAPHSIFPMVAAGRPDQSDLKKITEFAKQCVMMAGGSLAEDELIHVKGNRPYRTPVSVPVKPRVTSSCNSCGLCARLCPMQAIDPEQPKKFDRGTCISCAACIHHCPRQGRKFGGVAYRIGEKGFRKKCSERREPEFFFV